MPALFGVSGVYDKIKAGDTITVDADGQRIYKGEVTPLLEHKPERKNMMEGSPVHNTLLQLSRYIIPLHLIDPDDSGFRADNCRSLHDITRFIHEKSVAQMFNYGRTHGFDAVASKQLHDRVPMQWWVLNLDDGFKGPVAGRYVYLDDIVSIPMKAVWQGITAVPWDGPPPLDRRGLMSVMFQATANTSLNTGVKTKYSRRNYFMVSKNYCCLNSRLGFHFSTLESYVGEREIENYIGFRFQGGAADSRRREKRVRFISEILAGYGFKVSVYSDHLNARLKGRDLKFMLGRLKIIGYLTIHTRQLDMVTANPALMNRYRDKFQNDIQSAFGILKEDSANDF